MFYPTYKRDYMRQKIQAHLPMNTVYILCDWYQEKCLHAKFKVIVHNNIIMRRVGDINPQNTQNKPRT